VAGAARGLKSSLVAGRRRDAAGQRPPGIGIVDVRHAVAPVDIVRAQFNDASHVMQAAVEGQGTAPPTTVRKAKPRRALPAKRAQKQSKS